MKVYLALSVWEQRGLLCVLKRIKDKDKDKDNSAFPSFGPMHEIIMQQVLKSELRLTWAEYQCLLLAVQNVRDEHLTSSFPDFANLLGLYDRITQYSQLV